MKTNIFVYQYASLKSFSVLGLFHFNDIWFIAVQESF